jgi:hypothetical protein
MGDLGLGEFRGLVVCLLHACFRSMLLFFGKAPKVWCYKNLGSPGWLLGVLGLDVGGSYNTTPLGRIPVNRYLFFSGENHE